VFKKIPVIVSRAGGLPLQVKEGINGWLVPTGESEPVPQILLELWEGKRMLKRLRRPHPMTVMEKEEEDTLCVQVIEQTTGGETLGLDTSRSPPSSEVKPKSMPNLEIDMSQRTDPMTMSTRVRSRSLTST
jgi:hypothetical protein